LAFCFSEICNFGCSFVYGFISSFLGYLPVTSLTTSSYLAFLPSGLADSPCSFLAGFCTSAFKRSSFFSVFSVAFSSRFLGFSIGLATSSLFSAVRFSPS
jgi:hypothetical protein